MNNIENGIERLDADTSSLKEDYTTILDSAYVTDTASGAIASFTDGANNVHMKSLTVNIEPVQSGSGDPSPDNVRPISGHTQAVVTRCGANLIDDTLSGYSNEVLLNVGTWYAKAFIVGSSSNINTRLQFNKNGTWTNVLESTDFDGYMTVTSSSYFGWIYGDSLMTINVLKPVIVRFDLAAMNGTRRLLISNENLDNFVEFTDYSTYTIDLGGTIYGGTLDVGTGVLTVDRAIVDLGTLNMSLVESNAHIFSCNPANILPATTVASRNKGFICSEYKPSPTTSINDTMADKGMLKDGANLYIRDTAYSDATAFKAAMSGVQFVYALATPTTVQLTAQEVRTLLGQNNVFADCGDTTVEYRADTKLYIEKLTAPTEDDMVADHAISTNTFFMIGNTLYRATTAIASGATITVGTNATKLSLSDALNALT